MKGILWLASYPKSGNTWLRVFLANLRMERDVPADINALATAQFSSRELLDRAIGWKTADLRPEELAELRLPAQEILAQTMAEVPIKTHEVFADPQDGRALFSRLATRGVIYVVRNPLDVAISLGHHRGENIDATIAFMNDPRAMLSLPPRAAHLSQLLCDWSTHVKSWVDASECNVCVLRYEDMLASPEKAFVRAAQAAGIQVDATRIARAVNYSSLAELQRQEADKGFAERATGRAFFREGRSGGWREKLASRQVAAIVERHRDMMRRFGYLDFRDQPTA